MRAALYILILSSFFVGGCRRSVQTDLLLPNTYGVYALDGGVFTPLRGIRPAPDAEDIKYRMFSQSLKIIVFEKWVTDPKENINSISILDLKSLGEHPMDQIDFVKKPVRGHQDMFMIVSREPMKPGLYTLEIGNKFHDYHFGVQTPDITAYWNGVVKERPMSWEALNRLGAFAYMRRDWKHAEFYCFKAVQLNPQDTLCHRNLGLALGAVCNWDGAIEQFEAALKTEKELALYDFIEPTIHTDLGNVLSHIKRYDQAIVEYKEALKLDPNEPTSNLNLGYSLMQINHIDEAVQYLKTAIRIDPNMQQAQIYLNAALQMKNKTSN